jgi:hypothetical protein
LCVFLLPLSVRMWSKRAHSSLDCIHE